MVQRAFLSHCAVCQPHRFAPIRAKHPDSIDTVDRFATLCFHLSMRVHPIPTRSRPVIGFGAVWLLTIALMAFSPSSRAIEEPSYRVVRELDGVEIRQYAAYTVAEVVVAGPADEAGGLAFPILAGYIFGKNKGDRKLAMTAPVTQVAVPTKLAMTAPVTETAVAQGFLVQFVLPAGVTPANAPEPLDPRVQIRENAASLVAVIRYSGFWSDANYNEHLAKLQDTLRSAGMHWTGEAIYARYNAPFTPWFMRRNEIWLRLDAAP
jgi:hypothetical protein